MYEYTTTIQHSHKQVCVKVNAFVDEKIAPLIEALSNLPGVITEYSCEDNRSDIEKNSGYLPRAYVIFHVKEKYKNWKQLGKVCNKIALAISEYTHAEISIKWREGVPIGKLEFNTEDTYWLTQALLKLTRDQCCP